MLLRQPPSDDRAVRRGVVIEEDTEGDRSQHQRIAGLESLLSERLAIELVAGAQAAHERTVTILLNHAVQRSDAKVREADRTARGASHGTSAGANSHDTGWGPGIQYLEPEDRCGGTPVLAVRVWGGGRRRLHHWARILGLGRQGSESVGQNGPFSWLCWGVSWALPKRNRPKGCSLLGTPVKERPDFRCPYTLQERQILPDR